MNCYCHFIKEYAKVTHPLYDKIFQDDATKKKKKAMWRVECQKAFNWLKVLCSSTLILTFSDFTKPFKLHTDISTTGLGAILLQEHDGTNWVIGYASWALSKRESSYPANKVEFLALKWAVTQSLQEYL